MSNTEKYHTGFTRRILERHLRNFDIFDLRKARLHQEISGKLANTIIDLSPSFLLPIVVESNIWACRRQD
jgi:hypothetical protein